MAKEEKATVKQSKRQTKIGSRGGGNIGGLLLLGGALAVGSLVATFTARKGNRQKGSGENGKRKEDQSSQGLHFVLQSSSSESHGDQWCAGDGSTDTVEAAHIEPTQLVSTDNLMLEPNPSSEVDCSHKNSVKRDQETLLPKDPKRDGNELCDSCCSVEEIRLPEVNIPSLDKLDKDFRYDEAEVDSVEVTEEDAVDSVQTSREEITSVESTKKENDDGIEEKSPAEECSVTSVEEDDGKNSTQESPSEEIIEVEQEEEEEAIDKVIEEKSPAEECSVTSVEEDDGKNSTQESPSKEIIEVEQEEEEEEEAIDKVVEEDAIDFIKKSIEESSSVNSIDEEDDDEKEDNKQHEQEKSFPEEKIELEEEGELISVSILDKDRVVVDNLLPLKDITEVEHEAKDEAAEDDAMDAVKMCVEENSLPISTQDNNNTDKELSIDEKEDHGDINLNDDDESLSKASGDNFEFKTAGSVEANAQLLAAKTEQDEKKQSKEFNCFDSSKNNSINGFTDINQTRENSTFAQKAENLEFAVCNNQPTIFTAKSRISVEIMLMVASIVLLFLTYSYGVFYPSLV